MVNTSASAQIVAACTFVSSSAIDSFQHELDALANACNEQRIIYDWHIVSMIRLDYTTMKLMLHLSWQHS